MPVIWTAGWISEAQAQAEKIRAEGEAEYMRILSGAYNDEGKADYYNYIRSLDALKASLKGDNKTIILDENSELAKILRGNYEGTARIKPQQRKIHVKQ